MPIVRRELGEFANIYVGLPTKQSDVRQAGRSGNVLTVRALTGTGIDFEELVQVDLGNRDVDKYRAAAGDVLLSARSTTLKTAIVPDELDGIVVNATLVGVRCLPDLNPRLLVAYLSHPDGQAALEAVAQSATIQMNLTAGALRKIEVPLPPIEEQRQMVDILTAADYAYVAAIEAAESRQRLARQIVVDQILTDTKS